MRPTIDLADRAAFRRRVRNAIDDAGEGAPYELIRDRVLAGTAGDRERLYSWFHEDLHLRDKDAVFDGAGNGRRIDAAGVVAASRLYTPPHLARFLLENTLGALFMSMHPESTVAGLWAYRNATTASARAEPRPVRELRLLDPCCGCGAFLLPAFDLFAELYAEERRLAAAGRIPRTWTVPANEVPSTIVTRNLHGADLDRVAVALLGEFLRARGGETNPLNLQVPPMPLGSLDPATWSAERFDVVVTNPPFVGFRRLAVEVKDAVRAADPFARSDLAVAFQSRVFALLADGGLAGTVTPAAWTSGTESLPMRRHILDHGGPQVVALLGQRVFTAAPLLFVAATVVQRGTVPAEVAVLTPAVGSGQAGLIAAARRPRRVPRSTITALPSHPFAPLVPQGLVITRSRGPVVGDLFTSFDGAWTGSNASDVRYWWELPRDAPEWVRVSGGQGNAPWHAPLSRRMRREAVLSQRSRRGGIEYARVAGGRLAARLVIDEHPSLAGIVTFVPRGDHGADRVEELLAIFNSRVGTAWLRTLVSGLNFNPGYAAQIPLGSRPPCAELRERVRELVGVHRRLSDADPTSDAFTGALDPAASTALLTRADDLGAVVDALVCDHLRLDRATRRELPVVRRPRRVGNPADDVLLVATLRCLGFSWPDDPTFAAPGPIPLAELAGRLGAEPAVAAVDLEPREIDRWVRSRLMRYQATRFRRRPVILREGEAVRCAVA